MSKNFTRKVFESFSRNMNEFCQKFNEVQQKLESFLTNNSLKVDQTAEQNFTTVLICYLQKTKIYVVKFLDFPAKVGQSSIKFWEILDKSPI